MENPEYIRVKRIDVEIFISLTAYIDDLLSIYSRDIARQEIFLRASAMQKDDQQPQLLNPLP